MGHKTHPIGFRLGVIRGWQSVWYADKGYQGLLQEDFKIRRLIKGKYNEGDVARVEIERNANQVTATIHTAKPGVVIGRGGQRVDELRTLLEKDTGRRLRLNIQEIRQPELDAYLVARNIADQIERRVAYRRAMKQAVVRTMQAGARGIRMRCAGRLGGSEMARRETERQGRVPLHTLRADVDFGIAEAHTTLGRIGVKVWIYRGDILPERGERPAAEPAKTAATGAIALPASAEGAAEPLGAAALARLGEALAAASAPVSSAPAAGGPEATAAAPAKPRPARARAPRPKATATTATPVAKTPAAKTEEAPATGPGAPAAAEQKPAAPRRRAAPKPRASAKAPAPPEAAGLATSPETASTPPEKPAQE